MKNLWKEFVAFIMTGNVLMLAVAFVLGGLTKSVIDAFVTDIVNPIIGAIVGKPQFTNTFKIGSGVVQYGAFVTILINLVITGAALFLIVKGYDAYRARKAVTIPWYVNGATTATIDNLQAQLAATNDMAARL